MARTQVVISVFVASTNDLADERAQLEETVREFNATWSKTLAIHFELVKWETHTYPGIAEYPQAVINEQINDDYDVFVGLLWHKFGTPTPEFGSGTEEEWNRALERFRKAPGTLELLFYFKDAPIAPSAIDEVQLQKVKQFKTGLGEEGTYYWRYNSREQFANLVRVHLSRIAQKWGERQKSIVQPNSVAQSSSTTLQAISPAEDSSADLGLLDLIEMQALAFQRGEACLARINDAVSDIGNQLLQRAEQMNKITNQPKGSASIKDAEAVISLATSDINLFSDRIDVEIPVFAETYREALDLTVRLATLLVSDFSVGTERIVEIRESLTAHQNQFGPVIQQITGFLNTIANLPRFNKLNASANRRAAAVLRKLVEEIKRAQQLNAESLKLLKQPDGATGL